MATTSDAVARRSGASDALVPEPLRQQIMQQLPASSAVMSMIPETQRIEMSALTERIGVLSVLPSAYFVSGDTGLKSTGKQRWKNKTLYAEEIAVIIPVPDNYMADAQTPIWSQVRPRMIEAAGALVDAAVIFGTNKPSLWGPSIYQTAVLKGNVVTQGWAIPNPNTGALETTDLAGYVAYGGQILAEDGYDLNGFVSKPGLGWQFTRLRNSEGSPIYTSTIAEGRRVENLYGFPLRSLKNGAWNATEATLIGGDFTEAIVGVRQDITFKVFTEGVISDDSGAVVLNLMQQDSTALRMTLRLAWQVSNTANRLAQDTDAGAGSEPTESATRWPFFVLRGPSYTYS
jgi:HK97 family phage major capsid protein